VAKEANILSNAPIIIKNLRKLKNVATASNHNTQSFEKCMKSFKKMDKKMALVYPYFIFL